ncbi:MAG: N-acetylmuramoyl-L-alanine amidase [Methylovulum sp.]|nr:N-acetylmuramoyl-L-alanine amidase [Methylovulum sp.]
MTISPAQFSRVALVPLLLLVAACSPLVVLDAGHEPSHPGAIATCGKPEADYNEAVVTALAGALDGYRVLLTHNAHTDVTADINSLSAYLSPEAQLKWPQRKTLFARAALANKNNADVFISIHHDSTAARWQVNDPDLCKGNGGKKLAAAFKQQYRIGFNIFINANKVEPCRSRSLKIAQLIAKRLLAIGRVASDYHLDDCKSCRSIDSQLGIWHEDLAVLREAAMPAVLIEVGNIVDPDDEAVISTSGFQQQFAQIIKAALAEYFAASPLRGPTAARAYPACASL